MTKTDMPERIWATTTGQRDGAAYAVLDQSHAPKNATEYTRSDRHATVVAERDALQAENERLREALLDAKIGLDIACHTPAASYVIEAARDAAPAALQEGE